ncbi:MAG: hemolysin family protein [Candidatus Micrarchaeia archaeon]
MNGFWAILLSILVVLSGFFSASELALFSLSRVRIRRMVKNNIPGSVALENIRKNPERLITTIIVGNTITNISASSIATGLAISYFGDAGVGIATGVMTFVLLTFGEVIPKALAVQRAEDIARFSVPFLNFFGFILFPIIYVFEAIPRIFVGKVDTSKPIITEKEIRSILEIGVEENAIRATEHQMITRLLDFRDTPVRNAMLSIDKAIMLPAESSVEIAKTIAVEHGYSRYPVYSKEVGRVISVVHTKHLDRLIKEGKKDSQLREFLSKDGPILVSEDEPLDVLFRNMQKEHIHMAVVVDSKWNQTGIIAFEDLIEEIFGEIADEEERTREKKRAKK